MQNITVEEVKHRLDASEKLNLVDVREDHERADFNIGGTHFRLQRIQAMEVEDIEDLKDQEVIVYCRSGNRSGIACQILDHLGFTNTKNLVGGMLDWNAKYGR